jgi:hypothetical protein
MSRHPLGFHKITLLTIRRRRIRLHLWRHDGSEAPHDHRWTFIAVPLLGAFTDIRWATIAGDGYRAVQTTPPTGATARTYRQTATTADLVAVAVHVRRPLRPYRCRTGEIHSYAPRGRGPHVSLVLLARPDRDVSTVWQQPGVTA